MYDNIETIIASQGLMIAWVALTNGEVGSNRIALYRIVYLKRRAYDRVGEGDY
jgi:hypothetical protein